MVGKTLIAAAVLCLVVAPAYAQAARPMALGVVAKRQAAGSSSGSQQQQSQKGQPSFDCSKASNNVELMICADPKLGNLDTEMVGVYRDVMEKSHNRNAFLSTQLKWLKQRNQCTNSDCVAAAYDTRIDKLYSTQDWLDSHRSHRNH